ncbi:BMP-binding endothelial regulator protein-like [Neocloeon triangulifer]|uniref:BMP-binding endothelial regulator protein-like n=1 Tax=Neocloeon triangulifer TaxID=2078957 RepID=UPI00286F1EB1|nr:BMP-binding endothelial regulator protein-like [Neocloeon triangulifer]
MMANTFLLCLLLMLLLKVDADLKGNLMTCENEGMKVPVDRQFLCYNCVCKNRLIQCQPKHCPKTDDCVHPKTKSSDPCCPSKCKGCWLNGTMYESGTVWRPDPCTHIVCVNGVLTESQVECLTPCEKPLPKRPNECCARCPNCELRGYKMGVGTELKPIEAPCMTCVCDKKGTMICTRKACPVLNCPNRQQIETGFMECCPRCRPMPPTSRLVSSSTRQFLNPPKGHCLLGNWLLRSNQDYAVNSCSSCRCIEGAAEPTVTCKAQTCPSLVDCNLKDQRLLKPTDCCKTCVAPKPKLEFGGEKKKCIFGDKILESGASFKRGKCVACQCVEGEMKCAKAECAIRLQTEVPHEPSELMLQTAYCKRNFYLRQLPDQCCPECIEREGRCYVFGGQFKTFDDRHFSFHGSCKYQVVTDCSGNRTFSIRMSTAPIADLNGEFGRIVTVKLAEHKVTLGQRLRVKVDGKRVDKLPFQLNDVLELKKDGEYVALTTNIGLKLAWNGHSLLEISVPVSMHSKVCGLCGNFNGKPGDDFELQHGGRTAKAEEFVESWRAGGLKSCTRNVQSHQPSHRMAGGGSSTALAVTRQEQGCSASSKKHHRDYRKCMPIRSDIFKKCHIVVPAMRYYKACLNEMCMCRDRSGGNSHCHCQVIEAYIRECSVMAGASISPHLQASWRYMTGCYQEAPEAPTTLRQRRQHRQQRRRHHKKSD